MLTSTDTAAIAHDGPGPGVLVLHGFTGTTRSIAPVAHRLGTDGYTVRAPLLPGHGTTWQDCNTTTWHDWYGEAERALIDLSVRTGPVVVFGLSMGGTLATRLAQEHPRLVRGLALVNPCYDLFDPRLRALPLLTRAVSSLRGIGNDIKHPIEAETAYSRLPLRALQSQVELWEVTKAQLAQVHQPLLLFSSVEDHVVPPRNAALLVSGVSSRDVTQVPLHESYHVATLDGDSDLICDLTSDFVARLTASEPVAEADGAAETP